MECSTKLNITVYCTIPKHKGLSFWDECTRAGEDIWSLAQKQMDSLINNSQLLQPCASFVKLPAWKHLAFEMGQQRNLFLGLETHYGFERQRMVVLSLVQFLEGAVPQEVKSRILNLKQDQNGRGMHGRTSGLSTRSGTCGHICWKCV
jgi:hypothetical protein